MDYQSFLISRSSTKTDLFIGNNLFKEVEEFTKKYSQIVCVIDQHVFELYNKSIFAFLNWPILVITQGEDAKSFSTVEQIIQFLMNLNCCKNSALLAIGGGAILDVTGFVSSIYMRGIASIYIPTTLLAMVDAAIGGKTAIDHKKAKNILGTIYNPRAIFIDFDFLKTLSENQILQGKAEMFKLGLVYNQALYSIFQNNQLDFSAAIQAIFGKFSIVQKDPEDLSLRRSLNFGHTIGHALESLSDFTLSHGEAVIIGCLTEAYLSYHLKLLPFQDFQKIKNEVAKLKLSLPENYSLDECLKALSFDKKRIGNQIRLVLIEKLGKVASFEGQYTREISVEDLKIALKWMENFYGFKN